MWGLLQTLGLRMKDIKQGCTTSNFIYTTQIIVIFTLCIWLNILISFLLTEVMVALNHELYNHTSENKGRNS